MQKTFHFSMALLFLPDNVIARRIYDWLVKVAEVHPAVVFPREKLIELGVAAGNSRQVVWGALKNLEEVTDVAHYWDSAEKTVFYAVVSMTTEEKLKRIEDELWFEALPDNPPPPRPAKKK